MLHKLWRFIRQVISAYGEDRIANLSAALSYYTLFSLTPILLITISVLGVVLGLEEVKGQLLQQINAMMGSETSQQIKLMIENANKPSTVLLSQIGGHIALAFGATGVFVELQNGLNTIWGVIPKKDRAWWQVLKQRFWSFTIVLTIAFLFLVSLLLNVVLSTLGNYITLYFNISSFDIIMTQSVSLLIDTLLFAMMFKILPDAVIRWREVWIGAFITTLLFALGKFLLSIYINKVNLASTFGAAGSLVVLLVWVYYSAQIFFIGAEITQVFSSRSRDIVPKAHAVCTENSTKNRSP